MRVTPYAVRPGEVVMVPLWCGSVEQFIQRVLRRDFDDYWSLSAERVSAVQCQYSTASTTIHITVRTRK